MLLSRLAVVGWGHLIPAPISTACEVVRDALRRPLALQLFENARRQVIPFAEAQGIFTDENVFKPHLLSRICLDSNVLVAAFASRGLCADLLRVVLSDYHLVVPEVVVDEVRRILGEKIKVSDAALAAVEAVSEQCETIPRGSTPSPVPVRDPDDERVLADAISAEVQITITGDADLLSVAADSPIPILSPRVLDPHPRQHALAGVSSTRLGPPQKDLENLAASAAWSAS